MVQITAALVKQLREKTGAGMMDCKKALTETDGELEAAGALAIDDQVHRRSTGCARAAWRKLSARPAAPQPKG